MASACIYIECPVTKLILAVSRKDDPNAFGLPGGVVEAGETELEAAIRELREETGIRMYEPWPPHNREIFRREGGVTFRGSLGNVCSYGRPKAGETGRVAWVTPEQLMAGPFGDYNRRLLEHIGRIPKRPLVSSRYANALLDKLMITRLNAGRLDGLGIPDGNVTYKASQDAYKAVREYIAELEARAGEIESCGTRTGPKSSSRRTTRSND